MAVAVWAWLHWESCIRVLGVSVLVVWVIFQIVCATETWKNLGHPKGPLYVWSEDAPEQIRFPKWSLLFAGPMAWTLAAWAMTTEKPKKREKQKDPTSL